MDSETEAAFDRVRREYLKSIGIPEDKIPPMLKVGESKIVELRGQKYVMTRTQ